jgi:TolB protein
MRADGARQRNLSRHAARDQWPAWSPDGRRIAFMSDRDGSPDVFVMNTDGSSVRNITRTKALEESHPAWLPDGRLTFTRHGRTGPVEVWTARHDGSSARRFGITAEPVFTYDWVAPR